MRTRRMLGGATAAALLMVSLAGCVKMDMDLQLQSDDTVDGSMVFALSSALAEMSGEDPEALAESFQQDLMGSEDGPQNMRTEPYDDGEFIGATMFFEDESLDVFSSGAEEESLSIVREGDEFVVSGVMDLSEVAGDEMGLTDGMDIRIAVTFPGTVADHHGELERSTVTWVPVAGERLEINARGSAVEGGGGLSTLVLIGLGVLALAVVAAVVLLVLRNRSAASAVAPATADGTGYAAVPPTAFTPSTIPTDAAPGAAGPEATAPEAAAPEVPAPGETTPGQPAADEKPTD